MSSAADHAAVVDAAFQAAELGVASMATLADNAPLLDASAKRSDKLDENVREESEIKRSALSQSVARRAAGEKHCCFFGQREL